MSDRAPSTGNAAGPTAATRWLGRRLAWEHQLGVLRAEHAGTPLITPRHPRIASARRVA
jgi:hypothetical protein